MHAPIITENPISHTFTIECNCGNMATANTLADVSAIVEDHMEATKPIICIDCGAEFKNTRLAVKHWDDVHAYTEGIEY